MPQTSETNRTNQTWKDKSLKYILVLFNIIFGVTGIVLFAVGIKLAHVQNSANFLDVASLEYQLVRGAAATVIVVGILVMAVAVMGFAGACTENAKCLTAFTVFMIGILVLQLLAVILAACFHTQIHKSLEKLMNETMTNEYKVPNYDSETRAWNYLQIEMQCCGVNGLDDWKNTAWRRLNTTDKDAVVPQSCCVGLNGTNIDYLNPVANNATACYFAASQDEKSFPNKTNYVHVKGCFQQLNNSISKQLGSFIGATVAIILTQVIIVVMSCILKKRAAKTYEYA